MSDVTQKTTNRNQLLQAYRNAGFRLVRITPGDKKAFQCKWGDLTLEPENIAFKENVGLIFENGHYDLDFDTPEARKLSGFFFPKCPSFRRSSLPANEPGHRLVKCEDGPGGRTVFQVGKEDGDLLGKAMILEFRSSTAKRHHQTVVPPSVYVPEAFRTINGGFSPGAPGDALVWDRPFAPDSIPVMPWEELKRAGAFLSLSVLALKRYPAEGGRDNYCLAFAGALLSLGMTAPDADELVEHVAKLAGDEESRAGKATYTEGRKEDGVQVNGLPGFIKELGESVTLEKTVRRWFGEDVRNREGKSKGVPAPPDAICIHGGRHSFRSLLEQALIAKGAPIYRRFNSLVTPVMLKDNFTDDAGVTYAKDTVLLNEIDAPWVRFTCDELGIVFCDLKGNLAHPHISLFEDLFVKVESSAFPVIEGVSATPTIGRNEPGYDPVSRRVLVFRSDAFPDAPLTPTKDDAVAALARLREPVRCYRWGNDYSEAVWCASVVSGVIRSEMKDCPMFVFNARHSSSGKTILADCAAQVVAGGQPATMSWTGSHVENAKKLFSVLVEGATVLFIDNVPAGMTMDSDTLNQMITHQTYRDRVLGLSKTATVSTRVLILVTGNNMKVSGDLVSRTCMATIDPPSPRPEELSYDFHPGELVKRNRSQLVVDCLTIVRAYVAAGRPNEDQLPACRLEGFNIVRGALTWLGMQDPHKGMQDLRDQSEEAEERYRLFVALVVKFEPRVKFRAWSLADEAAVLAMVGGKRDEGDPAKRIGRLLAKHRDLDVGGITLKAQRDSVSKVLIWWYEVTDHEHNEQLWADANMRRVMTKEADKHDEEQWGAKSRVRLGD